MSFLALVVYAGEDVVVASLDDIWGSQLPVDTKPCKEKVEKEPKKSSAEVDRAQHSHMPTYACFLNSDAPTSVLVP